MKCWLLQLSAFRNIVWNIFEWLFMYISSFILAIEDDVARNRHLFLKHLFYIPLYWPVSWCVTGSWMSISRFWEPIANSTCSEFCWYKLKSAAYLHVLVHMVIIKIKWTSCPWKKNWMDIESNSLSLFYFKNSPCDGL